MNITYLINQYPMVSHSFIRTEIQALEALGHQVTRIAMRGWDADLVDQADIAERMKTHYVLAGGTRRLVWSVIATLLSRPSLFIKTFVSAARLSRKAEKGLAVHLIYLLEACQVLHWTEASKCQHVHAHFGSNSAMVAMLVRKLGGPPYSFTVHGPEEFDKSIQWKLREKIAGAKAVVAITSFCRSQLFRWSDPADWSKIEEVRCAVDPRFEAMAVTPPPATDRVVCVGRLCEQKGQILLVKAIAEVRRRGIPVSLVLAGDGEMREEIEHSIATAGLEDAVSITGWLSAKRVRDELENARALILPSFAEGLPVVIMEAMARGRPVLSTYVAGIPELVRDQREGMLVPAGDVEALAEAICALLAMDGANLQAMANAARTRVIERHSAAIEAERLANIFARPANEPVAVHPMQKKP